ncbi:MAG: thermonuclease family protein [Candidatus Aenigmarchaeota archaeon]|nr:thermonuclease family protein [Candidatus Aenigmarchaeota archaeon]
MSSKIIYPELCQFFRVISKKLIGVLIAICMIPVLAYFIPGRFFEAEQTRVTVARVIDGDTIELANGKKVRLLGIDAPEQGQYYYEKAKKRLEELVEGKNVILESDVSNTDKSGRLLRYVFVDDLFVNLELVKQGLANVYVVSPDVKYFSQLLEAESFAREKGVGIWKTSSLPYSKCIEVKIHYDAKGEDNKNLNDEYVVFKNNCDFSVDLTAWTVKDRSFNTYTFPEFELESQAEVTLYSGSGNNTKTELFWNTKYSVWNNDGDTLYLRDREGSLILSKSYGR